MMAETANARRGAARLRSDLQPGGTIGAPDTGTTGAAADAAVKRTVAVTTGGTYDFFIPQTPCFRLKSQR